MRSRKQNSVLRRSDKIQAEKNYKYGGRSGSSNMLEFVKMCQAINVTTAYTDIMRKKDVEKTDENRIFNDLDPYGEENWNV